MDQDTSSVTTLTGVEGVSRETPSIKIEEKKSEKIIKGPSRLKLPLKQLGGLRIEDLELQWNKDEERIRLKMFTLKKRITCCTKLIEDYKNKGNTRAVEEKERQLGIDLQEYQKLRGKLDGIKERLGLDDKTKPLKVGIRALSPRQIEIKQRTENILQLKSVSSPKC
jgi:hypothetical protein